MTQFTMDQQTPPEQASADSWTPERQAAAQEKGSWKGMDETVKDPADQTEDPADTKQPEYPEYQDNLADILKNAGVDDTVVRAAPDYEAEVDEMANPGVTPADIDGTDQETLDEGGCNMTEAGTNCPQHGLEECAEGQDSSPLAGQYGHSGKMKPVEKDVTFLDRLRELSGMMRK
jgi:hypothetical protein